jgi:hypothetical protein|uniref:Uncharacterized protein n=1 Tax=Siphoviridae sp. ctf8W5 TaxID=2825595 RepID=A0A8S5Q901_9CAUD|nr:MAG TPA: hypothetical protein [Siphoviridae sp. ctf8W5]
MTSQIMSHIIGTIIGIAVILLVELIIMTIRAKPLDWYLSQTEKQPLQYSLPRDTREEIPEHMVHDVLAGVTPDELKITMLMDITETPVPVIFTANELKDLMIKTKKWTISYGEKRIGKFDTKTEAEAARLQLLYECGKDNTEEDFEI